MVATPSPTRNTAASAPDHFQLRPLRAAVSMATPVPMTAPAATSAPQYTADTVFNPGRAATADSTGTPMC